MDQDIKGGIPSSDPLLGEMAKALNQIEGQAVCGPIAVDFDEALEMLERIAKLSRAALTKYEARHAQP